MKNPFGPAVGEIIHRFECCMNGWIGECFISSNAVIISQSRFLGIDVNRIIIPWRDVKSLSINVQTIIVETNVNISYALDGVDHLEETLTLLQSVFHDQPKSRFSSMDSLTLFNKILFLPENESVYDCMEATKTLLDISGLEVPSETQLTLKKIEENENSVLTEIVSKNLELECTLEEFISRFLADDAPYSLTRHHETIGDINVRATPWEDGTRKIMYSHPINLPGAPSTGNATKIQKMTRYGNSIICVQTETWISDVPLADCFFVSDRLIAAISESGKTLLTVQFGIKFVKKTLFRGIISATSVRDVKSFHQGFLDTIQNALQKTTIYDPPENTHNLSTQDPVFPNYFMQASKRIIDISRSFHLPWVLVVVLLLCHIYTISYINIIHDRLDQFERMLNATAECLII